MFNDVLTYINEVSLSVKIVVILCLSAIPFIESYFGSALGVLGGINPFVAVFVASAGNFTSMMLIVFGGNKIHGRITKNSSKQKTSGSRKRFNYLFEKYGVPGVSLLGQTVLPSQITSGLMAAMGIRRNQIIFWQSISIVLWGSVFAALTAAGISVVR